jgi:hypothetical protein
MWDGVSHPVFPDENALMFSFLCRTFDVIDVRRPEGNGQEIRV